MKVLFLKEINEWVVVKSLKNASLVAQDANINNAMVNSLFYKCLDNWD